MNHASPLILLTDTLSARFVSQKQEEKCQPRFGQTIEARQEINTLPWLTHCQQTTDRLSAGRRTDTLSLFRECPVRLSANQEGNRL